MPLIDMGSYYHDTDMKTTIVLDKNGIEQYRYFCPYIPKFLFDGGEIGSTDCSKGTSRPRQKRKCKR